MKKPQWPRRQRKVLCKAHGIPGKTFGRVAPSLIKLFRPKSATSIIAVRVFDSSPIRACASIRKFFSRSAVYRLIARRLPWRLVEVIGQGHHHPS